MTKRRFGPYPRVNCLVPGCRRGSTQLEPFAEGRVSVNHPDRPGIEWVCAIHWRRVPRAMKAEHRKFVRFWSNAVPPDYGGYWTIRPGPMRDALIRIEELIAKSWDRMVEIAKGDGEPIDGVPAGIAEELKRAGL